MNILGNSPGDYKDIKDLKPGSDDIKVDEGTLSIHNIQKTHEGHYLCEAVNGIGSGLSAVITISVQGSLIFLKIIINYINLLIFIQFSTTSL